MTDTCEKHCEATAFKIVIRGLEGEVARLKAERKPLTDEQMKLLWVKHGYKSAMCKPFARAIEAAHNIKENKHDATTE